MSAAEEAVEIVYVVFTHSFTARCPYCGDSLKGAEAISAAFAWASAHVCAQPSQTDDGAASAPAPTDEAEATRTASAAPAPSSPEVDP